MACEGARRERGFRSFRRRLPALAGVFFALCARQSTSAASRLNLYEWIAVAPTVVAGTIEGDDGKFVTVRLDRVFRGDVAEGSRVRVDVKRANREREESREALRLEKGSTHLLLLRREPGGATEEEPVFDLVRGIDGVRELPREGAGAWIEATTTLVAVQALRDERAVWRSARAMLEDTNPIVIETGLDLLLKFRRGEGDLAPLLLPLYEHPRPGIRARAARLSGQIAESEPEGTFLSESGLIAGLFGAARRDPTIEVRVAATWAIGRIEGAAAEEVLGEIARRDPEQAVRYEAEKILFDRRSRNAPPTQADSFAEPSTEGEKKTPRPAPKPP